MIVEAVVILRAFGCMLLYLTATWNAQLNIKGLETGVSTTILMVAICFIVAPDIRSKR